MRKRIKRIIKEIETAFFSHLVQGIVCFTYRTMRFKVVGKKNLIDAQKGNRNVILALWHNRSLLFLTCFYRYPRAFSLVSPSRDGEIMSKILRRLGYRVVRGSSLHYGKSTYKKIKEMFAEGYNCIITPDGPRGPIYKVQPGIIYLAKISGCPIIPVALNAFPRKVLPTWDGYILPYPFSRGVVIYGHPLFVSRKRDKEEEKIKAQELERSLREITSQAEIFFQK